MDYQDLALLVEKAQKGNAAAFETLCRTQATDILYKCISIMGNQQDGEDAAQEVFIQMQRNLKKLKQPMAFIAWNNRLINSVCLRMLRKRSRRRDTSYLDFDTEKVEEMQLEFLPQEFAEESEKRQIVLECLHSLNFKNRRVLVLFYYDGLTTKELAGALDITTKAAESALYHARGALKKKISTRLGKELTGEYGKTGTLGGSFVLTHILRLDAKTTAEEAARRIIGGIGFTLATGSAAPAVLGTVQTVASSFTTWAATGAAVLITATAVTVGTYEPPAPNNALPLLFATSGVASIPQHSITPVVGSSVKEYTQPEQTASSAGQPAVPESSLAMQQPGSNAADTPESAYPKGETPASSPSDAASVVGLPSVQPDLPGMDSSQISIPSSKVPNQHSSQASYLDSSQPPDHGSDPTPTQGETYTGTFSFVSKDALPMPKFDSLANGFVVQAHDGDTLLATATADEKGEFTLVLNQKADRILCQVLPFNGFGPAEEDGFTFEILSTSTVLEPIMFTDTFPPSGSIHLLDQTGALTDVSVNPAGARITVYDLMQTSVAWRVEDADGVVVRNGNGSMVDFAGLQAPAGLTQYTLYFTLSDAAGNTAEQTCDFVMLANR